MLKAILSYSKKIPVAGQQYSSHSYHLSLETEISEGIGQDKIQQKIHDTFELVKTSVEHELTGNGSKDTKPADGERENPGKNAVKASNRQIKYIMDLARERNITLADLNEETSRLYNVKSVYDLSKSDASKLVESLKSEQRKAA